MSNSEFKDEIILIDKIFAKKNIPIFNRPEKVTNFIINYLVISATNIDLNTEKGKLKMYIVLENEIKEWYKETYGEELLENPNTKDKKSFIIITGTPIEISFPMTIRKPARNKDCSWLHFPDIAMKGEMVFEYLKNKEILSNINEKKIVKIKTLIRKRIKYYRTINKNMMVCRLNIEKNKIINDINTHLNLGVRNIIQDYHLGISVAIWEFFFSVELALKLLYFDKNSKEIQGHKLLNIINTFNQQIKMELLNTDFIKEYPHETSIKYRYSELVEYDLCKVEKYYMMTLEMLKIITEKLSHQISFKNGKILIKNKEALYESL